MEAQIVTQHLGHLGIVASVIKELKIIDIIDAKLPVSKSKGSKVSMGERVAAMLLNGLGFLDNRLYMHSQFFENKPIKELLGSEVEAEDLHDDALGACLDRMYNYGVTKLFGEIAIEIADNKKLLDRMCRIDTTSLSVFGDYEEQESDAIEINLGFSKQKRFDLKQVVLSLTMNGKANIPIWVEGLSGNTSDKTSLRNTVNKIEKFQKALRNAEDFIYVADAAMYDKKLLDYKALRWISRVPSTIKEARELCSKDFKDCQWQKLDSNYKYITVISNYGDIDQRWQLIYSDVSYSKQIKTLEKNITKEREQLTKDIWHLGNKSYACKADAEDAILVLNKKQKYHNIKYELQAVEKYSTKGKPKPDSLKVLVGYKVISEISLDSKRVINNKRKCGRFIIATNVSAAELPSDQLLPEYKKQSNVEQGFKFIKNNEFMLSSIYLKKNSRIEALMMIMTLCLMVYNFGQYKIREALIKNQDSIPDQVKKQTSNPTLRWIFHILDKITVVKIYSNNVLIKSCVANLCDISKKIIRYFGDHALKIYDFA